jgi:hypothetical protein
MEMKTAILALGILVPALAHANSRVEAVHDTVKQIVDADIHPAIDASVLERGPRLALEIAANTRFVVREHVDLVCTAELGSVAALELDGIDDSDEVAHTMPWEADLEQSTSRDGRRYDLDVTKLVEFLIMRPSESGWSLEITYTILPAAL